MVIDQGRWFIYKSAVSTISSAHLRIDTWFGTLISARRTFGNLQNPGR